MKAKYKCFFFVKKNFWFKILIWKFLKSHTNITNQDENQDANFQIRGIKNRRSTIAMIRSTLSHSKRVNIVFLRYLSNQNLINIFEE